MELARSAGLCLKHNCNHVWRVDCSEWDQAVLCCTRYQLMTEAAAAAIQLAAQQARSLSCYLHNPVHPQQRQMRSMLCVCTGNISALTLTRVRHGICCRCDQKT